MINPECPALLQTIEKLTSLMENIKKIEGFFDRNFKNCFPPEIPSNFYFNIKYNKIKEI